VSGGDTTWRVTSRRSEVCSLHGELYRLTLTVIDVLQTPAVIIVIALLANRQPHSKNKKTAQPPHIQCKSKKSRLGDLTFSHFFHKRLRICNRFFTHLLNVPIFARLQIFIQLSKILTKLCHIKCDYPVHIICAKCPKRAKTREFRRLRKSLIALLIVVCGKSL